MSMSDNEMKERLMELVGEIKSLTNSLNHYTEAQERHREETEKRFDKQEIRNEKLFDKVDSRLDTLDTEVSNIKENAATEAAILKTIQDSNLANKRLAYGVAGSILVLAIAGGLAFKFSGAS